MPPQVATRLSRCVSYEESRLVYLTVHYLLLEHGYNPLPDFEEPRVSPDSRPDLATRYPLILTGAKNTLYCDSQHRGLPSLRNTSRQNDRLFPREIPESA